MAKYFNYFPTTFYSSNNSTTGLDVVTNLVARFGFESQLKENTSAFYKYQIQESDTPEIIASKYYDNSERHWIVLLFNDIIDPQWDWPLKQNDLIEYIDKKYTANGAANTTVQSGLAWALSENNIQAYFKVITTTGTNSTTDVKKLQIDSNTYANVAATTTNYTTANNETVTIAITKETRSHYTYEIEENELKREIKLLKKEFVPAVEKEFRRVVST
jgi:hypothetical protein